MLFFIFHIFISWNNVFKVTTFTQWICMTGMWYAAHSAAARALLPSHGEVGGASGGLYPEELCELQCHCSMSAVLSQQRGMASMYSKSHSFHLWAQEKKNQKKIKKQQKKGINKYIHDLQPRRLYALPLSALWSKNNGQWKWLAAKLKQYIKGSKSLSITCWLYCMGNQWDTQFSGIRKGNRMFT